MAKRRYALPKSGIGFLGKNYGLQVETSPLLRRGGFCELAGDHFIAHIPAKLTPAKARDAVRDLVIIWFKQQGAEIFKSRADHYAAQLGVRYQNIKITDPKTRWGTCDRHGNLNFSWRVLMTPMALVDYLVVHELCHIVHFNHSREYWATVAKIMPDYKLRRAALWAAEKTVMA